jgi:hypothetical protein
MMRSYASAQTLFGRVRENFLEFASKVAAAAAGETGSMVIDEFVGVAQRLRMFGPVRPMFCGVS